MTPLTTSLMITAIGMTLVFAALVLLALLMQALVALTSRKQAPSASPMGAETEADSPVAKTTRSKHKVAAIAAALALAEREHRSTLDIQAAEPLSAWQHAHRTAHIHDQGKMR